MYAILNYIMNIAARASTLSEVGTAGGFTIANYIGVSEANTEMKLLAGYLSMSIPFLCIAIVKGVGTFVDLASQMTGTSMQASSSAASEISSGNFSFGNVSMRNKQMDNVSQLQKNFSSSLSAGGHKLDTGGIQITQDASGLSNINRNVSSGITTFSSSQSNMEEFRKGYNDAVQQVQISGTKLSHSENMATNETQSMASQFSKMDATSVSKKYSIGMDQASQIVEHANAIDSVSRGHNYNDTSKASANLSIEGGIRSRDYNTSNDKDTSKASANLSIGGSSGISGGVESNNTTNHGHSEQISASCDFADTKRRFDTAVNDIATSSNDSALTQWSQNHSETLSKVQQYSQEKAYNEQIAKSYQESYNKASSLTVTEQNNLMDYALEIGTKEKGYSMQEAAKIMSSNKSADKEVVRDWYQEAASRTNMTPTMPYMKQPSNENNHNRQELQDEYRNNQDQTLNGRNDFNSKMKNQKANLQSQQEVIENFNNDKMIGTNNKISQKKQQIVNKAIKLEEKEKNRSKDGALLAAGKHVNKTLNPFADDD